MTKVTMANPYVGEEEAKAVYDTIKAGWLSMGPKVKEFEKLFAEIVDSKYAVSTNNGSAALHVALIASGIQDGDEVLVPDITFASTAKVVLYERAIPILVECDPETYNISLTDLEKKITKKTKAIMPVDMNGMPFDYDGVLNIANRYGLRVIADSAESFGAVYKNRKIGSIAPIHAFSFFPNKNITTGEGGMITTDDEKLYIRMSELRNMGQDYRYHHSSLGYNYRMTEISAVIGLEQLKKIDYITSERERIVESYNKGFAHQENIELPIVPDYVTKHAWYMYTLSINKKINRDEVVKKLFKKGVETRVSFPPIHNQPFYKERFKRTKNDLDKTFNAWKSLINLPIWVGLPKAKQSYVIKNVIEIVNEMN